MDLSAFDNADGGTRTYDNLTCLEFTVKTYNIVFRTQLPLCSCAIIVNLATIVFVFLTKRHTDVLYRLMVYLMVTDILQALAVIFISLPVTHVPRHGDLVQMQVTRKHEGGCHASAYFSMSTMWMGDIIFFWISLHLAYRGWSLYRQWIMRRRDDQMESVKSRGIRGSRNEYCIKEIVSVLILFVAPFAIASIPFAIELHHGTIMIYGLSGLWCWIKAFGHDCGDLHSRHRLLTFLLLFFHGRLMIIVMFTVIFIMVAFCCYCHEEVRKKRQRQGEETTLHIKRRS